MPNRNIPRIVAITLSLVFAATTATYATDGIDEAEFESLFDGKTLEGWDGNPKLWSVAEGAILGVTTDEAPIKVNEFLIWEGEASNFVLRFQFRIADRGAGNSGVQYRSKRHPDSHPWAIKGYQADIERTNKHMGILYEEGGRGILAKRGQEVVITQTPDSFQKKVVGSVGDPDEIVHDVKAGEWQQYEIVADGNLLIHRINGRETIRVTDHDAKNAATSGVLALQLHKGPAMQVEFRKIRIKHLPE